MDLDEPQIEHLERESGAFDIRVDGVAIWERIRTSVFRAIRRQHGAGQAHTVSEMTVPNYLKGGFMLARNLFYRNPFLADSAEMMFIGFPRRKREVDGLWWDIFCDPIHEASSYDYVHFEKPHLLQHLRPAKMSAHVENASPSICRIEVSMSTWSTQVDWTASLRFREP